MKALAFNDHEVAKLIMESNEPYVQKALGREVRGFVKDVWDDICEDLVVDGLVSKFTQNKYLEKFILDTGDTILVEASPSDKIWGIGLAEDDPRALDETQWRGKNLQGKALMRARDIIRGRQSV